MAATIRTITTEKGNPADAHVIWSKHVNPWTWIGIGAKPQDIIRTEDGLTVGIYLGASTHKRRLAIKVNKSDLYDIEIGRTHRRALDWTPEAQTRNIYADQLAQAGERTLAAGPRNPQLQACVFAMQARGFAALRRPKETLTLLERAEKALEGTYDEEPSTWVSHFDEGSLASEAARCMQQLGKPAHAQRHAERIIELRPADRTRSRAFGQLILIMALIEQGQPEQACDIAQEVLNSTQSLGSYLVVQQLRDIQLLLEPYSATVAVREFLECLAEAVGQRVWLYQWLTKDARNFPSGSTRVT